MNLDSNNRKMVNKSNKQIVKRKESIFGTMYYMAYFSLSGLLTALKEERSFRIHLFFGFLLPIVLAIICIFVKQPLGLYDWVIMCSCGITLLAIETLNSGLENTVDLITEEYHEYARKAKDQGSGAVFLVGTLTLIFNFIVFIPRLINLF